MECEDIANLLDYLAESVQSDPDAFDAGWQQDRLTVALQELQRRNFFQCGPVDKIRDLVGEQCSLNYTELKASRQLACVVVTGVTPHRTKTVACWTVGSELHPDLSPKKGLPRQVKKSGVLMANKNPPGCSAFGWASEQPTSMEAIFKAETLQRLGNLQMPKAAEYRSSCEAWDINPGIGSRSAVATVFRNWAQAVRELRGVSSGGTKNSNSPLRSRETIVLPAGIEYSEKSIKLARVQTAFLESHGDANAAHASLVANGIKISLSTFYEHLKELDKNDPEWRVRMVIPTESENKKVKESLILAEIHVKRRRK